MTAPLTLDADVLVLGGGPAGTWAALGAAATGARVVLADKGWCGTSGAAAAGGNNLWYLPPTGPARDRAVGHREAAGGHLTDRRWMFRVLDETWQRVADLADWGYPFPVDDTGVQRRGSLQGPEYLRLMRRRVRRAGVRILDHCPALELVTDGAGQVVGAAGRSRHDGWREWRTSAGAVVLATGGCAFLSGALGLNVDTGDGHLMAAEVGARLSGMEFSAAYALAPAFGAQTKGLMMQFATYLDEDDREIDVGDPLAGRDVLARHVLAGRRISARLDRAPAQLRAAARLAQPNYFLPLDKAGIDPFTTAYPIRFVLEGTVRGTGGLHLVDDDCATGVPGLYAAGDAATREFVTGAVSGGGSHNAAWAIASGSWAGAAAGRHARRRRPSGRGLPAGRAGLRPTGAATARHPADIVRAVQEQVMPLDRNYFRTAEGLQDALSVLDGLWYEASTHLAGAGRDALTARQAAAMVAHARWMYRAALARPESRGLHRRDDRPGREPWWSRRLLVHGLDEVRLTVLPPSPSAAPARPGLSLSGGQR
ncbi:FAD-binding protein [Micromonospora mangrovi]|uniref:FAD-binding protein n=2 Tax=Micromonospora TaxID=1873 RepID=A0AAU7MAP6_9ACTN